jgi:hypothetical protein
MFCKGEAIRASRSFIVPVSEWYELVHVSIYYIKNKYLHLWKNFILIFIIDFTGKKSPVPTNCPQICAKYNHFEADWRRFSERNRVESWEEMVRIASRLKAEIWRYIPLRNYALNVKNKISPLSSVWFLSTVLYCENRLSIRPSVPRYHRFVARGTMFNFVNGAQRTIVQQKTCWTATRIEQ